MPRLPQGPASVLTGLFVGVISVHLSAQGFQDVTLASRIVGVPHSTATFGSGLCCGDFDGDSDPDVIVAGPATSPIYLFRNDGGMRFTNVSAGCGLGLAADVHAMTAADVDNDGDLDLFVANWQARGQLFINDGSGRFSDQAVARGIVHSTSNFSATFGDYDRDGWLDLYLGNRVDPATNLGQANVLYRNAGNGFFADVTLASGTGGQGLTFASAFLDFDEDGWPDIIEVNDKGTTFRPNELYRNNRNGTFSPVAAQFGAQIGIDGMGVDFTDVFNDGGVDFYCSDTPIDHLFQLWEPLLGRFVNATWTYGLAGGGVGWAVNWMDYDNDGWQDLHVVQTGSPNLLFRNPARAAAALVPWPEVGQSQGLGQIYQQFTAIVVDLDDDGGLDIVQRFPQVPVNQGPMGVSVHRNAVPRGNWLKFRTRGTVSNRDGIGTRIEVLTGGNRQRQWVRSGVGFMAGSDMRLHFGLGSAAVAELVVVTWPSGQVHYLTDVPANQIVEVVEPRMDLRAPAVVGATTALDLSIPSDAGLVYAMALALSASPPTVLPGGLVLPLRYDALSGFTLAPGNPVLPASIGVLDASGGASSPFHVPNLPGLAGLTVYATGVTLDQPRFPLLRTLFPRAVSVTFR